jgi:hypothetical protein
MTARRSTGHAWRAIVVTLALAALGGCVAVGYQPRGRPIAPREGRTLLFGRLRFFHDAYEFFPWNVTPIASPIGTNTERHVWLLRLGRRAVSPELHPDPDGSLAIWLAEGDYALVGSTEPLASGSTAYEVLALFRVPAGPLAAYAGDLLMKTETHEGFHVSYGEFGVKSVAVLPLDSARAALEQKLGTLPGPPAVSPWCAGEHVPGFNDPGLASRAKQLLDKGCDTGP